MLARIVTTTGLDFDLGVEGTRAVEGADDLVGVDNGDVGVGLNVGGGHGAFAVDANLEGDRVALGADEEHFFQVKHDVSDVFDDAVDALKLVVHTLDFDRGDGRAFDGGQEDAAQGVADGVSVAGFKGFGDELA